MLQCKIPRRGCPEHHQLQLPAISASDDLYAAAVLCSAVDKLVTAAQVLMATVTGSGFSSTGFDCL